MSTKGEGLHSAGLQNAADFLLEGEGEMSVAVGRSCKVAELNGAGL